MFNIYRCCQGFACVIIIEQLSILGNIENFQYLLEAQIHILQLCFRLQFCTVVCFTIFKKFPTHIISADFHGTMVHLLQSLLVTVIVSQSCILCKSSRFILFQNDVKCQDDKVFFLGHTSQSISGIKLPSNGNLLSTLFYHH